jgi:hypothetical protein
MGTGHASTVKIGTKSCLNLHFQIQALSRVLPNLRLHSGPFLQIADPIYLITGNVLRCLFRLGTTWWHHGRLGHVRLYDNIWRRPDGVCVNDEGRQWDEHWQELLT